jgi:hypothetical protein
MQTSSHLPVWAGGLIDQPYIWSLQFEIIDAVVKHHKYLADMAEKAAK